MLEILKPFYNSVLMPIARIFAKFHIHPNAITLLGLGISGLVGWYAALGNWRLAAIFIVVASCMDGLDGLVARVYNKKSVFGAIFDSSIDRLTEIIWLLGICMYFVKHPIFGSLSLYLTFTAITGSLMVSYVRARCEGENIPCKGGFLQRPERIIVLLCCFVFGPKVMFWGLALLSFLAYTTVTQRIVIAYLFCKKEQSVSNRSLSEVEVSSLHQQLPSTKSRNR